MSPAELNTLRGYTVTRNAEICFGKVSQEGKLSLMTFHHSNTVPPRIIDAVLLYLATSVWASSLEVLTIWLGSTSAFDFVEAGT